jgi:hypothetical protein
MIKSNSNCLITGSPSLKDCKTDETLVAFGNPHWSLDAAVWQDDHIVIFTLRKYPGKHMPIEVVATINCLEKVFELNDMIYPLTQIEQTLDNAIAWQCDSIAS